MTEPTPPPERPLPDDARARMRSELLAHAHENRSRARAGPCLLGPPRPWRWWPASATGRWAPDATMPTSPSTPVQVATGTCPEELPDVLPGAELAFDFPGGDDGGTTSFFVKGDQFVLYDIREGTTTVQQPMPLTPQNDPTTYAVSTLDLGRHAGPRGAGHRTIRVGDGIVPEGAPAFDVAYTFPDGHTETATKATDDQGRTWWLMVYAYDDGGGNELNKPPIEVTVSYSGAVSLRAHVGALHLRPGQPRLLRIRAPGRRRAAPPPARSAPRSRARP
jgi:hypothetical protein